LPSFSTAIGQIYWALLLTGRIHSGAIHLTAH
jgi:hypothetical protein